jgi:hypothetical protein
MTPVRLDDRLGPFERTILPPKRVDVRDLADARQRSLDEVERLARAQGVAPADDPEAVMRELDRALEAVSATRHRARPPRQ